MELPDYLNNPTVCYLFFKHLTVLLSAHSYCSKEQKFGGLNNFEGESWFSGLAGGGTQDKFLNAAWLGRSRSVPGGSLLRTLGLVDLLTGLMIQDKFI